MTDDDYGPLFTPNQYALASIERPDKQKKPRPEAPLVAELQNVFDETPQRTLWMIARKLYTSVGNELAKQGLLRLVNLYGWLDFIKLKGISPMTQVSRIEQAAAACDAPREIVAIAVEMKRRQRYLDDTQQALAQFFQEVHTAHPAMRRQIKQAMEMVLKGSFAAVPGDPAKALPLAIKAVECARKDTRRIQNIQQNYRVPKDTANWLVQIVARLASDEREKWSQE